MLMIRKYNPRFASQGEIEAQRYSKKLVLPGRIVSFLLAFPMTQWVAAIVGIVLGLVVYAVGGDFRQHERVLAADASFWRRLWLMRRGATFLVVSVIAVGVALGQTVWLGKTHAFHEVVQSATTLMAMTQALFR